MKTTTIDRLLAHHEVFAGLDPAALELIAGCCRNAVYDAGALLAREGQPADVFYIVRGGSLAMELHAPGGPLVLDTAGPDDVVGWSWIFPPFRWTADVEALTPVRVIVVDGACLRGKCDDDPALGYALMKRFARVASARLEATRLRLLDIYGVSRGR